MTFSQQMKDEGPCFRSEPRALSESSDRAMSAIVPAPYDDADLSWIDECNCFRCESCEAIVALGFMLCPHCGGFLAGLLEPEPPAPRDRGLEPDNGFVCFECGLLWRSGQDDGCPACGGILLPVRVREGLLS